MTSVVCGFGDDVEFEPEQEIEKIVRDGAADRPGDIAQDIAGKCGEPFLERRFQQVADDFTADGGRLRFEESRPEIAR